MTLERDTYGASQLNLQARLFWCEDLGTGTIEQLIDADGEDTDEDADAVVAIVKFGPDCWLTVRVRDYQRLPRN